MRLFLALFFFLSVFSKQFNVAEMTDLLDEHWRSQMVGEVDTFVSHLAPDFTSSVNGEPDGTPWNNKQFVQRLFKRVAFTDIHSLGLGLAGRNSIIVIIEWNVHIKDTFEDLTLGEWQQTYVFNEDGKISKISSICDGAHIQKFSDLMSDATEDYKPIVESLVAAFNAKSVHGVMSKFEEEPQWSRNGFNDTLLWIRPKFLTQLFQEQLSVKLDAYAPAAPRTAYVFLTWTHVTANQHTATIADSWFLTWSPERKISNVRVNSNGQEQILYASIMKKATDNLTQQKKDELVQLYRKGSITPVTLAVHLDL